MRAKLFDAHNKFLHDCDTPDPSPTLQLTIKIPPLQPGPDQAPTKLTKFRLMDTDETGALIYREVEDSPAASKKE
jgi:hypothetical protein